MTNLAAILLALWVLSGMVPGILIRHHDGQAAVIDWIDILFYLAFAAFGPMILCLYLVSIFARRS